MVAEGNVTVIRVCMCGCVCRCACVRVRVRMCVCVWGVCAFFFWGVWFVLVGWCAYVLSLAVLPLCFRHEAKLFVYSV